MDSFYCVAQADRSQNLVCAKLTLPTPLSASKHEIALKYCSLVPKWAAMTDLYMIYRNDSGNIDITVFDDVYITSQIMAIARISQILAEKYGFNMKTAKVKIIQSDEKFWIALAKKSSLTLSDTLSKMLGLPKELSNTSTNAVKYTINLSLPARNLNDDIYYLTCDQVKPNLISDDLSGYGVLDVIHAADTFHGQVVRHYASEHFYRFHDFSRPSSLYIRLLDKDGNHISIDEPQFYVMLHIRQYG